MQSFRLFLLLFSTSDDFISYPASLSSSYFPLSSFTCSLYSSARVCSVRSMVLHGAAQIQCQTSGRLGHSATREDCLLDNK